MGGAKVADKLGVLKALLHHVDALVVGGGMAFTFLAAQGHDIGGSLVDRDRIDECASLLDAGTPIHLPTDIVALEPGASFGCDCTGGEVRTVGADVPDGWQGLDIGPDTVAAYAECIVGAATVLWNGPMGVFEDQRFCAGTAGVAAAVAAVRATRWSAEATARRPSTSWGCPTGSTSSRPAGGPPSSCSSSGTCRVSPPSAAHPTPPGTPPRERRRTGAPAAGQR